MMPTVPSFSGHQWSVKKLKQFTLLKISLFVEDFILGDMQLPGSPNISSSFRVLHFFSQPLAVLAFFYKWPPNKLEACCGCHQGYFWFFIELRVH